MLFKNFKRDPGPYVFAMFALTGGFLEAFTFLLHGGVFCNAQTGNLVMLVINFAGGDFPSGLRYLYSILAYVFGILLSVVIPLCLRRVNLPLAVTAAEIAVLAALAFIPESVPDYCILICAALLLPVLALFVADSCINFRRAKRDGADAKTRQ